MMNEIDSFAMDCRCGGRVYASLEVYGDGRVNSTRARCARCGAVHEVKVWQGKNGMEMEFKRCE